MNWTSRAGKIIPGTICGVCLVSSAHSRASYGDPIRMKMDDRVRSGFEKQGLMSTLGAKLVDGRSGRCSISVPYSDQLSQQHGFFHGGVTAAISDNAAGFAGHTLMGANEQPLTVEFKINFLAPAQGDALEARAKVVKSGRRLKHVAVEVFAVDAGIEKLVAMALVTVASSSSVRETDPSDQALE